MSKQTRATDIDAIEISDLPAQVRMALDADLPLFILSRPGSGKSAITAEVANKERGMPIVEFRGAQHDATKLGGLDVPETIVRGAAGAEMATLSTNTVKMLPTQPMLITELWDAYNAKLEELLIREEARYAKENDTQGVDRATIDEAVRERAVAAHPGVLCFFDEVTAATMSVQSALLEYVLDRRGSGYPMPPKTRVLLAGNRPEDKSGIRAVNQALVNRTSVISLNDPDGKSWIRAMASRYRKLPNGEEVMGLHPMVQTYIQNAPGMISTRSATGSFAAVEASPRQWMSVDTLFQSMESKIKADLPGSTPATIREELKKQILTAAPIISGMVGTTPANELTLLGDIFALTIPASEIMRDPNHAVTPADTIKQLVSDGEVDRTDHMQLVKAELMQLTILVRSMVRHWCRPKTKVSDDNAAATMKAALTYVDRMSSAQRQTFRAMMAEQTEAQLEHAAEQARNKDDLSQAQVRAIYRRPCSEFILTNIEQHGRINAVSAAGGNSVSQAQDFSQSLQGMRESKEQMAAIQGGNEV